MGKPPGIRESPGKSPDIDHEKDMAENGANPKVTSITYIVMLVLLIALFALLAFGLHKPTGG